MKYYGFVIRFTTLAEELTEVLDRAYMSVSRRTDEELFAFFIRNVTVIELWLYCYFEFLLDFFQYSNNIDIVSSLIKD